ncbi:MAG: tRNA 4-thiouridine(8) synthase ThiI [Bacilli bacterium]|nr:tRNA 4-thiouridine(8) synthase ThiI [Bacilli bacterium]
MNYAYIMVHYGELSTKGGNKKLFINCLNRNIRHALSVDFPEAKVTSDRDHTYVEVGDYDVNDLVVRLQDVSGIQRITPVVKVEKDMKVIDETALELIKEEDGTSFKVKAKRADKQFPLDSFGIMREVSAHILRNHKLDVDLHNPEITLTVDIRDTHACISCHTYKGCGGYPLGMNGKAMMLLSGGIDSPVASYLLIRRGIKIETLHFAAPPYTSDAVIDKLTDIIKKLNVYQEDIKLNIVPFTELQLAIYEHVDEPYCITIMRRMMMRIATAVAKDHNCHGLATGESVGQVASQTLESMIAINDVTNYPIIRPLATVDKNDCIDIAKKIDTYEISIRPYEDCCTIFTPKKPKTKPRIKDCEWYESKWDWQSQVEACIKGVKSTFIKNGEIIYDGTNQEEN